MKGVLLFAAALIVPCAAMAQGVRDPSTPNSNQVFTVNPPQQPSRPTATPNVPTQIPSPPLGVRRAHPSRSGVRGSGGHIGGVY
jgi:hypothetical protein